MIRRKSWAAGQGLAESPSWATPPEMATVACCQPCSLPELTSLPGGGRGEFPELACYPCMGSYPYPGRICVGLGADLEHLGLAPGHPFFSRTLGGQACWRAGVTLHSERDKLAGAPAGPRGGASHRHKEFLPEPGSTEPS